MKHWALLFGVILVVIGLAGYFMPSGSAGAADQGSTIAAENRSSVDPPAESKSSITALIPACVGVLLLACGLVAMAKPESAKDAMHVAAAIALLGALAATGRGIPSLIKVVSGAEGVNTRATTFLILMAVVCWTYVVLSVRSFLAARAARITEAS